MCPECGERTSVTAGTIFDRTRTPLTVWFAACWMFATAKDGTIRPEDLPDEVRLVAAAPTPSTASRPGMRRSSHDPEAIRAALDAEDGNRERAAARLGISRVTLWKRMKRLSVAWP